MSQEKVDRYKKEKKNRAKNIKVKKIKKAVAVFVVSLGVGALIGIPLGKHIYKVQKEEAERNKTITDAEYESWFEGIWNEKYGYSDEADANQQLQDLLDQYNASVTDASELDASSTDAE